MLTFRRSALVAAALLVVFLLFSGRSSLDTHHLLRDHAMERRLAASIRETEAQLHELQQVSSSRADRQEAELHRLQTERRILEKQIQELRRLPDSVGVAHQLSYQFPYDVRDKFPAYVWQTWKVGYEDPGIDDKIRSNFDSWRQKNEGFVHEILTDDMAYQLVRHLYMNIPAVLNVYSSMPEPILRADFFRYLILLARGGVYSDADTEALKPVPVWIPASIDPLKIGLVVGIEADPGERPDWADWFARHLQFCQWTIQAKPGHPVLRDVVTNITEQTLAKKLAGELGFGSTSRGTGIMDWTGPGVWTDAVFRYLNSIPGVQGPFDWKTFTGISQPVQIGDVLILPITSFSPGIETMGAQAPTDPMAYVLHHFEGSWKPEAERMQ